MAPELTVAGEEVSSKADVYSLGILYLEILNQFCPFLDRSPNGHWVVKEPVDGQSWITPSDLTRPGRCPVLEKLMRACTQRDASVRPSAAAVREYLEIHMAAL